ncbi:MAG TPA: hypothetical protein VGE20_07905 [Ramlibacter sp.]
MFFGLFKRTPAPVAKPKASKRRPARQAAVADLPPEPSSLEVTEGSDQTDWALWEDSVAVLDSRMQSLHPSVKLYRHEDETPTEIQDIEAFARVRHKDP